MALRSVVHKVQLNLADMDRGVYGDHALTLALHPSETEERMMVRLLAYALAVPADDHQGRLEFCKGLSDVDEPDLWRHDLSGVLRQWIEVGQPDERRLQKACARADEVMLICYAASAPIWFEGVRSTVSRLANLRLLRLPADQSQALAKLANRSMRLQVTVQDGMVWFSDDSRNVELQPEILLAGR